MYKNALYFCCLTLFLNGCATHNGACLFPVKAPEPYVCGEPCGDNYTYGLHSCAYCRVDKPGDKQFF